MIPLYFGCLPAKRDPRNFRIASLLLVPPTVPEEYDFDIQHNGIPTPMFANDKHGCCVISGRAHQTLRFEDAEQNAIITIADTDVLTEWYLENGNTEDGLYILDSLKRWRSVGWPVAGTVYKIQAFAEVTPTNHDEVRSTIYSDVGIMIGVSMPDTWRDEFIAGKPWADTRLPANPENGHCVYVSGYTRAGPVCVTWSRKQQMTWEWFDKYCTEAYAIIDARDSMSINQTVLKAALESL